MPPEIIFRKWKNIDGKKFYKTLDDIKSKKVGALPFFALDEFPN